MHAIHQKLCFYDSFVQSKPPFHPFPHRTNHQNGKLALHSPWFWSKSVLFFHRCETCGKSFSATGGLRQHFLTKASCRVNASEGAYSIKRQLQQGELLHMDQYHQMDNQVQFYIKVQLMQTFHIIGLNEGRRVKASFWGLLGLTLVT